MHHSAKWLGLVLGIIALGSCPSAVGDRELPVLDLPEPRIAEVYRANWVNTLEPCISREGEHDVAPAPHVEPERPWGVDVDGHYPGWYPAVDVKHMAAAYLACGKDLDLVLRAWDLTTGSKYLLPDGSVRGMTFHPNPHAVVPEATADDAVVYYPLRLTANIDLLLLGDMIFRFSRDEAWLRGQIGVMRRSAEFLEEWTKPDGLLHSDSYDLDQVYREIDGVANASLVLALRRLANLEAVLRNPEGQQRWNALADRVTDAIEVYFWNPDAGYYEEHLAYNNVCVNPRPGVHVRASSVLDLEHAASHVVDGIRGMGIDAFGVGVGAAGAHEWASNGEGVGAWIEIQFDAPVTVGGAVLFNRTNVGLAEGGRFAEGVLTFSDNSAPVAVVFNDQLVSRAAVRFAPRTVRWVRFTGTRMRQGAGGGSGLAEIQLLDAAELYCAFRHGMTDTNFALAGFGVSNDAHSESVWRYFKAHEPSFYGENGIHAPTWIAEVGAAYEPAELNKRAPFKDCVAMARIWRYDALMRRRFHDGEGLVETIRWANQLFDRPSGGGAGYFAERYDGGRYSPGDEAQYSIAKYSGYPAIYNSFIVQQALLGVDVDVWGVVTIDPCVPERWYSTGFSADGLGVIQGRDIGFSYTPDRVEVRVDGTAGAQTFRLRLPPGVSRETCDIDGGRWADEPESGGSLVGCVVVVPRDGSGQLRITLRK